MEDSGAGRGSVRGLCPRGLRAKAPRGSPPSRHCEQVRGRLYGKGLESKIETHTRGLEEKMEQEAAVRRQGGRTQNMPNGESPSLCSPVSSISGS